MTEKKKFYGIVTCFFFFLFFILSFFFFVGRFSFDKKVFFGKMILNKYRIDYFPFVLIFWT